MSENLANFIHYPDKTARDTVYIYGQNEEKVEYYYDGKWYPVIPLCSNYWLAPIPIKSGVNELKFKTSLGENTIQVERVKREKIRAYTHELNIEGIPVQGLLDEPTLDFSGEDTITQIHFKTMGASVNIGDKVEYTLNDGLLVKSYYGYIINIKVDYDNNGGRVQYITAQSNLDRVNRFKFTGVLEETYNGEVLEYLFKKMGFSTVFVPRGNLYTGPRSFSQAEVWSDVMKEVMFIESWQLEYIDETTVAVLPIEAQKYVDWTFQNSQVVSVSEEIDYSLMGNKMGIAYANTGDDLNVNYTMGENVPDWSSKPETFSFFTSDSFTYMIQPEADLRYHLSPDSVLFFAVGGGKAKIDWSKIKLAQVLLKFNNAGDKQLGGSLMRYTIDLDVFPDKCIAVGYYDIRMNHLLEGVPLYYQYYLIDDDGKVIGDGKEWHMAIMDGGINSNFEALVWKFGVELSPVEKLGEIRIINGKVEHGTIFHEGDKEVLVYTDVGDLAVQTIQFDLEKLEGVEIYTKDNQLINGNEYLYGVQAVRPNKPIRRAKKVMVKLEKSKSDYTAIINVYGRRFISARDGWEDYESIRFTMENEVSIEWRRSKNISPATVNCGYILSSFISTRRQAEEKLRRMLYAREWGLRKRVLRVQGYAEMKKGQLCRLFTTLTGSTYKSYAWIKEVRPTPQWNELTVLETTPVKIDDYRTDPVYADLDYTLADALEELTKQKDAFTYGVVQARKYRGTYKVELDDGTVEKYCLSRVKNVNRNDRVALITTKQGSYIIIAVVEPSMAADDLEDRDGAPDDITAEDWENKVDSDPTIPSNINGRPLGSIISVKNFIAIPFSKEGYIPYKGVVIRMECHYDLGIGPRTPVSNSKNFRQNVVNFLNIKANNREVSFTVQRKDDNNYDIIVLDELPFEAELEVALEPRVNGNGEAIYMEDQSGKAFLKSSWKRVFKVQPELKLEMSFRCGEFIEFKTNQVISTGAGAYLIREDGENE